MSDAQRVELVAAALRRHLDDLDLYAGFLQSTLEAALPEGLLEVERRQTIGDRLRGHQGAVVRLSVMVDEHRYVLHSHRGAPRAEIVHVVRGLELDHNEVLLDEWITRLADALVESAARQGRAVDVLARITDPARGWD